MDIQKVINHAKKTRGYLDKKSSRFFIGWQKRFWIFIEQELCYFKDESLQQQKGRFPLNQITNPEKVDKLELKFTHQSRIYELRANTIQQRDKFFQSLKILIQNQPSRNSQLRRTISHSVTNKVVTQQIKSTQLIKSTKQISSSIDYSISQLCEIMQLRLLARDIAEKKIICRIAFQALQDSQFLFIVSCKSLNDSDYEILEQQYAKPLEFNTLYKIKPSKQKITMVTKCSQILFAQLHQKKTLKINYGARAQFVSKQDQTQFYQNLLKCMQIGKEYHNEAKLPLKINIDGYIKIYDDTKGLIERRQKIKIHFETQFLKNPISQKKINYETESFFKTQDTLMQMLKDFINACLVKSVPRVDLIQEYSQFMHEKIYSNFKEFWNKNHLTLRNKEILQLCLLVYRHDDLISKYVKDQRVLQGSVILSSIYFRKLLQQIEEQFKTELVKNQNYKTIKVQSISCTYLHTAFGGIIRKKLQETFEICHTFQIEIQACLFINKCYKKWVEVLSVKIQQIQSLVLLTSLCNETLEYQSMVNDFNKQFKYVNSEQLEDRIKPVQITQLTKILESKLIRRIFLIQFSTINKNLLSYDFLTLNIEPLTIEVLQKLKILKELKQGVLLEIKKQSLHELIIYYLSALRMNSSKINSQIIIKKINSDRTKLQNHYSKILTKVVFENIIDLLVEIVEFLEAESPITIRKNCMKLKNNYLNFFDLSFAKTMIDFKTHLPKDTLNQLYKICAEVFQKKQSTIVTQIFQPVSKQTYLDHWATSERRSTLTLSLNPKHNIQMGNLPKTKVLEGYLEKKKLDQKKGLRKIKKFYQQRYFRILDGNLLWYLNMNSTDLQNRIGLAQIKKIYKHETKDNVFFIQLSDCTYKFKAPTEKDASRWMDELEKGISQQKKAQKIEVIVIQQKNQMFKDYFTDPSPDNFKQLITPRESILSSLTQKKKQAPRKQSPQKTVVSKTTAANNSLSRIQEPRGCWFGFKHCMSLQ